MIDVTKLSKEPIIEFHPMNASLQKPFLTYVKRPDGQVNVSEPAEDYLRHVAADRKVFADLRQSIPLHH